ncbi:MAG TPA: hypothetical protein VFV34_27990, partial [Blastocatellia bacterium]|nr:hypothetical protein [Blastocatellia bacterium]
MKMKMVLFFLAVVLTPTIGALATSDPNFHIFLCFGQSNMDLKPESVPLLAGEKAGANKIIKRLPERLSAPPRPQG